MIFKNDIKKSVIRIANLIKLTAGASGRTVLINNGVDCVVTKDGISVLMAYQPKNKIETAAKLLLQQALSRQLIEHGDGTTATACFMAEFLKMKLNLADIKAMDNCIENFVWQIEAKANKQFNIKDVAMVSSNFNEKIADIITTAIDKNGVNGTYFVDQSSELGLRLEQINGFEFKSGFADPIFMNKAGMCDYVNSLFLIKRDITITDVSAMSRLAMEQNRPLVIIGDYDEQVKQSVIYNHSQGVCRYGLVKLQEMGKDKDNLINDLNEIVSNTTRIVVKAKSTIIEHNSDLTNYIIKLQHLETSSDLEKEQINKRIASLKGQVCKIFVGERTNASLRSTLDSIDDCIKSCISALKYGTVQGGGYFLYELTKGTKLEKIAYSYYACILKNAGVKPKDIFINLNKYGNVVDSAGVVISSLRNAWAGAREILYSKELINK
jgi:chaperonin GroEL